jgi:hypothetical protein
VKRASKWFIVSGALLLVVALLLEFVGLPAVIRFPLNTDQTAYYQGTFSEYVDQQTLLPLAHPLSLPLSISRSIQARSGSFSTVVVTEDDTIRPGPLTLHQDFQYVMNRRTMTMDNGQQTEMFSQKAKVDIAGAIRVTFPFGTTRSGRYDMWSPETNTSVLLTNGSAPRSLRGTGGPPVIEFSAALNGPPSPYYQKWLAANGFPLTISPAQLEPRLQALGVDVPTLLATLMPRLTPSQQRLVTSVLASPVKLDYRYSFTGTVDVDPTTGIMVRNDAKSEGLTVAPSLSGIDQLTPLLTEYGDIPAVATLQKAINQLAADPPQPVVTYAYGQTPASARHMADLARSQGRQIELLSAVPWVVGGIGIIAIGAGLVLIVARLRRPGAPQRAGIATHPVQSDRRAA